MDREHARQTREKTSFGVILADVDHFKSINDRHGHLCGDAVLTEVAHRLVDCIRPYDTLGRYGGEEFLAVVPVANDRGTLELAERMRKAIEFQPFATVSGEERITASFGVIASSGNNPLDTSSLLQLADEALYRAKQQGRNRSELATAPELENPAHGILERAASKPELL